VGNSKAKIAANNLGIGDWWSDDIPDNIYGICEGLSHMTLEGHKVYKCRFPVERDSHFIIGSRSLREEIATCEHYIGKFYMFEIEEVGKCLQ